MADKNLQRRLAAIMVADVVAYSRLMEADEAGTHQLLRDRRKGIIEPTLRAHGGRIVKLMGDGFLVEFSSAVSAVNGAAELQQKMNQANADADESQKLTLRIGINLGDVIGEESDIYGEGVNVAARLEALAEPGGICLSDKVYREVQGKTDLPIKSLGPVKLKNISAPVSAYAVSDTAQAQPRATKSLAREFTSIAVLPFANMSGTAEQDYFADGITEDIITELSRLKNLAVVARNTVFAFKGQPATITEVGHKLGADFIVEGSIRLAGQRVRATVQLIDVTTGAHVFAEKFDRSIEDIFQVQDEIVEAIAGRLFFNLYDIAGQLRAKNPTTSISAYTYWLRAIAAFRTGEERKAREYLHEAVRLDPSYAPALAMLGVMYAFSRYSEPNAKTDVQTLQQCQQFARLALQADSSNPQVLSDVAACYHMAGKIDEALRYSEKALSISPNNLNTVITRGAVTAFAGRHEEGLALVQRACRSEPILPPTHISSLGDCFFLRRRFDQALAAYRTLLNPPFFFRLSEAACLVHLGLVEQAKAIAPEIPLDFDMAVFARNAASMCALSEDGELWLSAWRKCGLLV